MQRIPELDGLRLIAILGVFCVHFRPAPKHLFDATQLGWIGVDLFFAISGFLITGILLDLRGKEHPFKHFYWRRALRIFPAYYVSLALIILLAVIHGQSPPPPGKTASAATFLVSLGEQRVSWPLLTARLAGHQGFGVAALPVATPHFRSFADGIVVFWSLSVEELFYLLWAPIILLGSRRSRLVFCIAPFFVCPVIRAFVHTPSYPEMFLFFCRLDSLAAGACVALAFGERQRVSKRVFDFGLLSTMISSGLLCLALFLKCGLLSGTELRSTTTFAIFGYPLLAIFFAATTGLCVHCSGRIWLAALRWKPITYIGKISYSMYLIHIPVYVAVGLLWGAHTLTYTSQILHGVAAVFCTIALSAISWKYFESPILALRDRPFSLRAVRSDLSIPVAASTSD
jgi:peptidoglycan/LPS O-acetylase OafA/YrhL